jgi:hypothetical protein
MSSGVESKRNYGGMANPIWAGLGVRREVARNENELRKGKPPDQSFISLDE